MEGVVAARRSLREGLAAALARRGPVEEVGLAGAVALVALGVWVGIVTIPTRLFDDLGGGYHAFAALTSIGLALGAFLLAGLWLRRLPRAT